MFAVLRGPSTRIPGYRRDYTTSSCHALQTLSVSLPLGATQCECLPKRVLSLVPLSLPRGLLHPLQQIMLMIMSTGVCACVCVCQHVHVQPMWSLSPCHNRHRPLLTSATNLRTLPQRQPSHSSGLLLPTHTFLRIFSINVHFNIIPVAFQSADMFIRFLRRRYRHVEYTFMRKRSSTEELYSNLHVASEQNHEKAFKDRPGLDSTGICLSESLEEH